MAFRIARGLFRLWIVFSVLWIAGVVVVTWWTFPMGAWVIPSAKYRPTECAGKSDSECYDMLKRYGSNFDPDAYIASGAPEAPPGQTAPFDTSEPYRVLWDEDRRAALEFASALALIPPILVLVFGLALGWAFTGFRP